MGSQLGHQASKTASLVPSGFGDESNSAGEKCQSTNWLSRQSARKSERLWVRIPVGSRFFAPPPFPAPVTYSGSVWVHGWAYEQQKGSTSAVPSRFGDESI